MSDEDESLSYPSRRNSLEPEKPVAECTKEKIQSVMEPATPKAAFDLDKALSECSKEKIQIPGFIQPDGALFCVDKKTLRVLQCSANAEAVLGIPLHKIIKTDLDESPLLSTLLGLDKDQVASLTSNEIVDFTLPQFSPGSPTSRHSFRPNSPPALSDTPKSSNSQTRENGESAKKVRRKSGEFIAFSSTVPSPSMNMQLFGALSPSNTEEDIQLMIVEVEFCGEKDEHYKRSRLQQKSLHRLSLRLSATSDILEACRVAAEEVRTVTGLDRVMVYEFDREWHGDILIELTATDVTQAYLGLRFPASDIPPQARRLYTVNPFRMISNTFYEPCPVIPTTNPLTGSPLDMSHSTFRSVSPVHIQYLKNINVGASVSISIVVHDIKLQQKKLFGLLVCHHRTPIFLPYDVRETCIVIGQLLSLRVENLLHNKMEEKRIAMKEMVHSIATSHFATSPSLPTPEDPKKDMSVLITEPQTEEWVPTDAPYSPSHPLVSLAGAAPEQESYALEVLRLFDADYGLIVVEGMRRLLGNADSSEVVFLAAFEQYVAKNNLAQILSSHNIAKTLPGALPVAEGYNTSGVLYVPLSLDASSYLALFRYEQVAHVKWAGAPQKTVDKHPITNQPALMPRTSFHIWTEEVRGSSREWTELEIETAHSLFVNLMELMRLIRLRVRMVEETIARQKIEQEKHMAEASNKMKSQFLANLSHEVRTPLNAILGMVDLTLSTTKVDPTQANYLAAVQHASESLLLIINDLLDISKIEAGKLVLVNDTFEFVKLIEQTVSAYKLSIERKGVTFRLEIDSSISDVISTDSVRLCQVLTNLLSNAKKYTITGSIEMRVSCVPCLTEVPNLKPSPRLLLQPHTPPTSLSNAEEEKEEAKEKAKGKGKGKEKAEDGETKEKEEEFIPETIFLHFSISDTGVGIPQEKIDSVFEPFEQVDSQLTRKVGGTGLGLSICRRIVRLMGGQLWCESLVNHGSTFHFEIPVETGPRRRTVDGSAAPPRNGTDFLNLTAGTIFPRPADATNPEPEVNATEDEIPKVLVVEDNTLNQKVAVNFLRRLNLASEVAGNGEIAVNLYRDHPHRYGAILMDICMPVKDGLVASSEIRAFEMLVAGGRSPRLYHANIALGEAESSSETRSKSSNFRRVPIVALSAQVMDQDRDACMNAGMDGFLEKPVRFENLKRLLTPIFAQYPKWQNPDAK